MKKRLQAITQLFTALLLVSTAVLAYAPKALAFDQNMVISDSMFDNTGTMSASGIDAFLNRYPSSCISLNNGFRAPDPTGYTPSTSFTYGGDTSAGNVIYDAAIGYGLNPQVIITTLQKEQSLVTGSAGCSNLRYSGAMGNGCPDGGTTYNYSGFELYSLNGNPVTSVNGTCVNRAEDVGFSRQVVVAAWKLRFWEQRSEGNVNWNVQLTNSPQPGDRWDNSDDPPTCYSFLMTQGYRARCKGNTPTYFDGLTSIDGSSVSLTNGATAAMYVYTPHFPGNQNFVNLFENTFGFGSTTSGMLSIAHPDGTLVRPANSPQVYLITNGKAQYATSLAVLQSWGYDMGRLKIATQGDLNLMSATDADTTHTNNPAPLQFREGTLVKGSGPTIYVLQNVNGTLTKESLDTWANFTRLGYSIGQVLTVSDSQLPAATGSPYDSTMAAHPNGTMIRDANSPTVYYIIGGERHSMTSLPIFLSHGFKQSSVEIATAGDDQLPITWPVNWFAEGTLLRGSGPTVYIIQNTNVKRSFGNYYVFVGLDYHFSEVMQVSDGDLPAANGTPVNN